MKYSEDKVNRILLLHKQGLNPTEIAKELNTYNTTIRRILLREGLVPRTQSEERAIVKTNPFINLNDEQVQYWLGYIAADGNISKAPRNRVNVATNLDPDHLNKYIDFIGYPIKLLKYLNKKYQVWEYSVNFANKEVRDYLVELGLTPNKSLTLKLNFPITWHFLRGLFDGDGCVRKCGNDNVSLDLISASIDFINQIQEFLIKHNILCLIRKHRNLYFITINRKEYINLIYHLMYDDSSISLDRKREKYGSLLKKLNSKHLPNSVKAKESTTDYVAC